MKTRTEELINAAELMLLVLDPRMGTVPDHEIFTTLQETHPPNTAEAWLELRTAVLALQQELSSPRGCA